jgi:hypothetical protein
VLIDKNRKPFRINRLVACAFIPNDDPKTNIIVNHIDENKLNNHYKNLEWVTQKQNTVYSVGIPVKMLDKDTGKIIKKFDCLSDACRYLDKPTSAGVVLKRCCDGIFKTMYKHKWEWC